MHSRSVLNISVLQSQIAASRGCRPSCPGQMLLLLTRQSLRSLLLGLRRPPLPHTLEPLFRRLLLDLRPLQEERLLSRLHLLALPLPMLLQHLPPLLLPRPRPLLVFHDPQLPPQALLAGIVLSLADPSLQLRRLRRPVLPQERVVLRHALLVQRARQRREARVPRRPLRRRRHHAAPPADRLLGRELLRRVLRTACRRGERVRLAGLPLSGLVERR